MAISLEHFSEESHQAGSGSELRLVYQLFEDAQRARIAHGERVRAFLQGRSFAGIVTGALLVKTAAESGNVIRIPGRPPAPGQ